MKNSMLSSWRVDNMKSTVLNLHIEDVMLVVKTDMNSQQNQAK